MRLQVKGKNVEITPSLHTYIETKLGKLEKRAVSTPPAKKEAPEKPAQAKPQPQPTAEMRAEEEAPVDEPVLADPAPPRKDQRFDF